MPRFTRTLLPLGVIAAGFVAAIAAWKTGPQAIPETTPPPLTYVEVLTAKPTTRAVTIDAMGIVTAEKQVTIQPEIAGKIIEQNHALVVGGRVAAGDPLVRIDARDYASAVTATQADLAQAKLSVREEGTLRKIAEHEWRDRPEGLSEETLAFALRDPHLDAARARVASAQSRIDRAKRDLSRTILRAPFDALVLAESAEVGQSVTPGFPVATLAGIARYTVEVSLSASQLPLVDVPGVSTTQSRGSTVRIATKDAQESTPAQSREGYVLRLRGDVDPRGRMAQLIVAIDDPLGVTLPLADRPLPLLLGSYVHLQISGKTLEDVFLIPHHALRNETSVWILDDDDKLRQRSITVLWREPSVVFVGSGLTPGERVVVTPIAAATEGMRVVTEPRTPTDEDDSDR